MHKVHNGQCFVFNELARGVVQIVQISKAHNLHQMVTMPSRGMEYPTGGRVPRMNTKNQTNKTSNQRHKTRRQAPKKQGPISKALQGDRKLQEHEHPELRMTR